MRRPCIGDDDWHAGHALHAGSDAGTVQNLPIMPKFGHGHGFVYAAHLEEAIELRAGPQAEQLAQFTARQSGSTVFLDGKCLERPARQVHDAETGSNIVGTAQSQIHFIPQGYRI